MHIVPPTLASREAYRRIVIAAIARDNRYIMSTRREFSGEIREVLCRGDHIRVKALIQQQYFQTNN